MCKNCWVNITSSWKRRSCRTRAQQCSGFAVPQTVPRMKSGRAPMENLSSTFSLFVLLKHSISYPACTGATRTRAAARAVWGSAGPAGWWWPGWQSPSGSWCPAAASCPSAASRRRTSAGGRGRCPPGPAAASSGGRWCRPCWRWGAGPSPSTAVPAEVRPGMSTRIAEDATDD